MKYKELKTGIRDHLNNAAEDFFMVGYYLRQISDNTLFIEDGYKSIWDFAKGEYGLSTSSASRFMAINARFSIDGGEHMDQKYIGMGPSKLQEMLGLSDEDLEKVTQETTVKELRAMKAAKLSYFKLPKTEYEEGSLLTTPGCGHKHDCFSCCHPCNIRQEERICKVSNMAEKRPCPHTTEDFLKDVEAGMYKDECQFLHLELAEVRAGDQEPTPCCLDCKYKGLCFSSCDVAKKKHQEEVKEEQKRLQAEQKKREKAEREAAERAAAEAARRAEEEARKKQEPSEDEIRRLFDYWDLDESPDPERDLDPKELKRCHRYESSYSNGFEFTCEANGVTINGKKRLTWLKVSKALTEVFNSVLPADKQEEEPEQQEKEPEIIDAEFKEVEDKQPEPEQQEQEPEQQEQEQEQEKEEVEVVDPEHYEIMDVKHLVDTYTSELKIYEENEMPENTIRKIKILLDATTLLYNRMTAEEESEDD
jgi:hypothetical protein